MTPSTTADGNGWDLFNRYNGRHGICERSTEKWSDAVDFWSECYQSGYRCCIWWRICGGSVILRPDDGNEIKLIVSFGVAGLSETFMCLRIACSSSWQAKDGARSPATALDQQYKDINDLQPIH